MKCYRCGYILTDRDIYCSRCGAIATDIKEGLNLKFFIPLRLCRLLGVLLLIIAIATYGICFFIMKEVHIIYFGFSVFLSAIGIVYIPRSYDSLAMLKQKEKINLTEKNHIYCKHCHHEMNGRELYCARCGYKRK